MESQQSDASPSFCSQTALHNSRPTTQSNTGGGIGAAAMATTAAAAAALTTYPSKARMSGQSQDPLMTRPTRPHHPSLDKRDVKPVLSSSDRKAAGGGGATEAAQGDIASNTTAPTTGNTTAGAASATAASTAASSTRIGGGVGEDDLADSDESVMSRLAEFTEMARRTAVHNEELSRELTDEKRRVAHTSRKLEQSNSTCAELRESLALAQDTVIKLREHEIRWAESTASEMSLRAEVCALKDEHNSVVGDATVLRKRCEVLQRENNELGERFASMAEEKRQVETRARRLLRSDRYRGGY